MYACLLAVRISIVFYKRNRLNLSGRGCFRDCRTLSCFSILEITGSPQENSVRTFKWTPSQTLNVSSLVATTRSGEFRWGVFFVFATCWSVTVISRAMLVLCHKFPRTSSSHCCIYLPQVWPGRVVGGGLRVVGGLAGLQVGCTVNTVVVVHLTLVWFTFNTGGVVHLKHRCGSP